MPSAARPRARHHRMPFVLVILAVVFLAGRVRPVSAQGIDARAVAAAQQMLASDMVESAPRAAVDEWLRMLAGPAAALTWEANDCGEQTGNPLLDRGRDMPVCAEVRITWPGGRVLSLSFLMGTRSRGVGGQPVLFMGQFTEGGRPTAPVPDIALVPSFMSTDARRRQVQAWAEALPVGTTRAEVERALGHPAIDGGAVPTGHSRYYLGLDVKVEVPYETVAGQSRPTDRVTGGPRVVLGPFTLD